MRKFLATTTAIVVGLALAGCGGGNSASTGTGGASTGTGGAADTTAAKAYLDSKLPNPTSINVDTPLSKKPESGKLIVGLNSGTPSAQVLAQYWKQAAEVLGWTYKEVNSGATPAAQQKAMDTAIQLKANGIATSGIPISTIATQLKDAQSKGIWVNTSATTDKPTGAMFDTSIVGPSQLQEWGKMIAADVVVASKGKAKILLVDLPVFPILLEFGNGFKSAIAQWCPGCQIQELPQQAADIGTKTPASVVSALQKAPDTSWVVFGLAELGIGVQSALEGASITNVHIGGLSALPENYQALKDGKQDAWTAYPLPVVAYRQIDSFARKFNGDPILDALIPTQVATQDNVKGLVFDGPNYIAVSGYQDQFRKLWHVG